MSSAPSRRSFLHASLAAGAGLALAAHVARGEEKSAAAAKPAADAKPASDKPAPKLKKAVKFGMIGIKGSIEEKFNLIKKLGFQGVEMDSPGVGNKEEAVAASQKTGIEIHGVVISTHWKIRHSDPDPAVREKALGDLLGALRDAKALGGSTALLVPGVVNEQATFDQCWERSTEQVKKAIPLAKELGVKIAIEVVWNNFLTTPDQLIKYVDQFQDPAVGAYFDVSNMIKYGVPPAEWIRKLGKRMLKFDFKGYNGDTNKWVAIGEGTENWPEVLKALDEVGYTGWATAEVGGGGEDKLRDIAERMDKVLGM